MARFVPRQRKHKVLARERAKENGRHDVADTNQEILDSADKLEWADKRARMKEELRQEAGKMNSKKAKRLEKYIDTKLRKDENRELLAKLASRKIDTSLFSSSKSLGQGRETKKQSLSRALREARAGIDNGEELLEERREAAEDDSDENDDNDDKPTIARTPAPVALAQTESKLTELKAVTAQTPAVLGSGLKRPLDLSRSDKNEAE
ncbi:putative ATP-dependent RNA helicase [Beauveria bassiana]|nr:putative ATP-dependent RNA helicase [Beauveria bassiana]